MVTEAATVGLVVPVIPVFRLLLRRRGLFTTDIRRTRRKNTRRTRWNLVGTVWTLGIRRTQTIK